MKLLVRSLLSLFLVAAVIGPSAAQTSGKEFNAIASRLVREFETQHGAKVGVSTQVLKSGKVPFSYNGTLPMIPASNLKLVTTAVALDVLGPDFRFETRLYGPSDIKAGVMQGDLVLKGGGDPTFFAPFVDSATSPFKSMASVLKKNGVKRVTGNLVVDDSDYDRKFIPASYHERYLLASYAAPVGGLGLNRNVVTVSVGPDGGLSVDPPTGSLQLVNKVEGAGYDQIWAERQRGSDKVVIHGFARPGSTVQTTLTVADPVRLAASVCYRVLKDSGIGIDGQWRTVEEGKPASLKGMTVIARHRSPRLLELVERTNRESDNLLAEHIFKRLGATVVGLGNAKNSESVVRDFFKRKKISADGLKMADGSGLSEQDRIAPFQMVYVLRNMWDHKDGQKYIDSLPGPGEGTLRGRLGGALVRAKTGTLNNHSGLSGYVVTAYGETVGFSILVNNMQETWPAIELEDEIVSMLARWERPL